MPGSGTSTRHPSSVAVTWKDGEWPAAVRTGSSFQNWSKTLSSCRWKVKKSSTEFQRVIPSMVSYLLSHASPKYLDHACLYVKYIESITIIFYKVAFTRS